MTVVRKATLKDVSKIVEIHVNTWRTSYRGYISDELLDSPYFEISEKRIQKMKTLVESGLVFVIEEAGGVVGFLGLGSVDKTSTEIKVFYISPLVQRKGYGAKLLEYVKTDLKGQGVQKINLFTLKNYPISNHFYQKQGFIQTGNVQFLEWANVWCHEYQQLL